MTTARRKRLLSIVTFGTLLTLLVLAADWWDKLIPLERYLYDFRVRFCQSFSKPATNELVHVDIDDGALAQFGQWPWPRNRVAAIIEELNRAGAKAIVLDILFSEAAEPELRETSDGTIERIDHDTILAETIKRAGNVVLAISPQVRPP